MAGRALAFSIPIQEIEGSPTITEQQIAIRAYHIWQQNGEQHGQDEANWFQAVAELERPVQNDSLQD